MQERWAEGFFFGKEVQVFFVYDYKDNIKKYNKIKIKEETRSTSIIDRR